MSQPFPASINTQTKYRVVVLGSSLAPDCMESHVLAALQEMGHDAWCLNAAGKKPGNRALVQRIRHRIENTLLREPERVAETRLIRSIAELSPDLVLVIQGNQLSPKTVARLRKITSIPIVCWCQDAISSYGRQYILGAEYDAVFIKDRYLTQVFSAHIASTTFYYLPEACNPNVHRTVQLSDTDRNIYGCEVLMLGSLYYYRQELLRQLTEFDLRLYGHKPDWLNDQLASYYFGSDLVLENKARAIGSAVVSLNPLHCAEIDALNCRAFELAGCGGFQVVSDTPVLHEHFIAGQEVETFSSVVELKEKIHHYLKYPEQAAAIAVSGQKRAHTEHTYRHRLSEIMAIVLPRK